MKKLIVASIAAITALAQASAGDIPANIKSGIENPLRNSDNVARDGERKPGDHHHAITIRGYQHG